MAYAGVVPPSRQLAIWRHGFYGENAFLYDFEHQGFDAYVSDTQRATRLQRINDPIQRALLNDKLVTFLALRALGAPTPTVYGYANGERLVLLGEAAEHGDIDGLLDARGTLVVKPRGGSGGKRFMLLERRGEETLVNGEPCADVGRRVRGSVVVSEFVRQHPYARAINPGSTNTMRVLVLRDADTGEPFVACVSHRFGTQRSAPVDNVASGGMSAEVDVETGVIGPLACISGVHFPEPGPVRWLDTHPDTGAVVRGTAVPRWSEIVAELLRLTGALAGLFCVGWDVAVTEDHFTILEGNNRPDTNMQVFRPFLVDPRIRKVFEAHGVVGRSRRRRG